MLCSRAISQSFHHFLIIHFAKFYLYILESVILFQFLSFLVNSVSLFIYVCVYIHIYIQMDIYEYTYIYFILI